MLNVLLFLTFIDLTLITGGVGVSKLTELSFWGKPKIYNIKIQLRRQYILYKTQLLGLSPFDKTLG